MKSSLLTGLALAALLAGGSAWAQPGNRPNGPVATACKPEIAKYCAEKKHMWRQVRSCLAAHRDELSDTCKHALDTTGRGRGPSR